MEGLDVRCAWQGAVDVVARRVDFAGNPIVGYSVLTRRDRALAKSGGCQSLLNRVGDALYRTGLRVQSCSCKRPLNRFGNSADIEPAW